MDDCIDEAHCQSCRGAKIRSLRGVKYDPDPDPDPDPAHREYSFAQIGPLKSHNIQVGSPSLALRAWRRCEDMVVRVGWRVETVGLQAREVLLGNRFVILFVVEADLCRLLVGLPMLLLDAVGW